MTACCAWRCPKIRLALAHRYSSASLASVCSAVAAGLGVSLLPLRVVQAGHVVLGAESGLPVVQGVRLALYARSGLSAAGQCLQAELFDLCANSPVGPCLY